MRSPISTVTNSKSVNGAFGYQVVNQLLRAIAERLKQHLRPGDVLCRVGEDEFCFGLKNIYATGELTDWINGVMVSFTEAFQIENCDIFMSVCMGIALDTEVNSNAEALLQAADTAMYKAKGRGKGCHQIFNREMTAATLKRLTLETDLQRAIAQQEFSRN